MGFGEVALGELGLVLTPQPSPKKRVVPVFQAYDVDVMRRDVAVDENGFYKSIHPVDHRVRLALITELGAVPADPSLGSTINSIEFDTDERMTVDGARRVRRALAALINVGDVELIDVIVYGGELPGAPGRLVFEVAYRNTRIPVDEQVRRQLFVQ